MRQELASLRARVTELETQIEQLQTVEHYRQRYRFLSPTSPVSIYEKEVIGYVWSNGKLEPLRLAPLSNLNIHGAFYTPLTAENKSIGAILVEPPHQQSWSSEEITLTEALARQVALQIQNLRLLQAAERARIEAQAATRRYVHESWANFLDAIHQNERIGFLYDQTAVEPLETVPEEVDFKTNIQVLEEYIGQIAVQADPEYPLTEEDKAFIHALSRQLAQQTENLRLLAEATRARAEAEAATRRLTRQSWQEFAKDKEKTSLAFLYDLNRVLPLQEPPGPISYSVPLTVRGEPIGEMAVAGLEEMSPEMTELMQTIAAQVSLHLETVRLTEELQKRALELQELDRLKSAFLANMSHELRTPLNSILGFADVILEGIDGPLTPEMENDLRLIQKNGQHLLALINDVLDMAKIEAGRMNLYFDQFNLYDLIQNVLNITTPMANSKGLALMLEPDTERDVVLVADETRIKQVLLNVVNNAIKFTERGYVSVHAARVPEEKVLITVTDTGIGIPEDQLEKIFQEFSQVDTSTTRKVGGTGLGLPISRRLVELHGGRMWAESAGIPGQGSVFYIELPLKAKSTEVVEKRTR
ncbi:MAG: ATP-binding protein [Anaerolineales bacterium]|nr:ATP-binding protein [Anaerolineales bacterium]MCX7608953.1 ATP-binding protein [Anaerolineales bacterium]